MQGKKEYQEKLFANFQLSERVPSHNFYRRLKEVLDLNFLYLLTRPPRWRERPARAVRINLLPKSLI